jgi:hypothetical protein
MIEALAGVKRGVGPIRCYSPTAPGRKIRSTRSTAKDASCSRIALHQELVKLILDREPHHELATVKPNTTIITIMIISISPERSNTARLGVLGLVSSLTAKARLLS